MARIAKFPTPLYRTIGGVGIGQLEIQTGWPADKIRQWIADGLLHTTAHNTISSAEVSRFRQEHEDVLP